MSVEACTIVPLGACPGSPMQLQPDGKVCIVGRSAGANIRLDHQLISRQHASFCFQHGRWTLTDLGSRHGTKLNGVALEPRQPMPLRSGDRIGLMQWSLRFEVGGGREGETIVQTADIHAGGTVVFMAPPKEKSKAQVQLDLLINSSVSIYAAATEAQMAIEVSKACVGGTKCERALVVRFSAGEGRLEVIGAWPSDSASVRPISRTLLRGAAQGKPVRLGDSESHAAAKSIIGSGVSGALCIPIMIDSAVEAFLYLDQFEGQVDFDATLIFSEALGRWCGLAITKLQRMELESRQRDLLEELAGARRVQERMMGAVAGSEGGVVWAMCSIPGEVVAGDIFGVHLVEAKPGASIFLGDVSGKGLGPGLLMAAITAHLEAQLSLGVDTERAICDLSNFVTARASVGQFATIAMVAVDPVQRMFSLCDAGHGYYIVVDRVGNRKFITVEGGIPIGVVEGVIYETTKIPISTGDRIILYSDGLAEQRNDEGEMLGADRAATALQGSGSCAEDVSRLTALLKDFAKHLKYADDVTIASVMLESDTDAGESHSAS